MATTAEIVKQLDRLRGHQKVWAYLRERLETDLSDVSNDGARVRLPLVLQDHVDDVIEEVESFLEEISKELKALTGE